MINKKLNLISAKNILIFVALSTNVSFAMGNTTTEDKNNMIDVLTINNSIEVDLKYSTNDNFLGRVLNGYHNLNKCYMKEEVAIKLAAIQEELQQQGFGLKLFDCYRPQLAVDDILTEIKVNKGKNIKDNFVPNYKKQDLINLGYVADKSKHTAGYAVDLTIIEFSTKKELDMGSMFDLFDEKSNTLFDNLTTTQKQNRKTLLDVMERNGFKNYHKEWWHFNYIVNN